MLHALVLKELWANRRSEMDVHKGTTPRATITRYRKLSRPADDLE